MLPLPNTTDWAAGATDIYSSRFWRLHVREEGAGRAGVWRELSPWVADGCLLAVSSHDKERESKLSGLFLQGHQAHREEPFPPP